MAETVRQQAFEVFDLLTEQQQFLVFELIKNLAPNDIVTSDDISVHIAAMEDYRRGETIAHDDIDW